MVNAIAIILAAGESSRMGQPKWRLPFNARHCFLEALISVYLKAGISRIVVVMNPGHLDEFAFHAAAGECVLIGNNNPGAGRIRSVELGISAMDDGTHAFLQNVDNPFTTADLIDQMWHLRDTADYVVPVFQKKRGHPLLLGPAVLNMLRTGHADCDFKELLHGFPSAELHCSDRHILVNINTPETYNSFFPLALK
ncbi:MAG TPA: hypothetical protein DCR43_06430 [Bacteroidales bacterium]|nr:MAG: hypothetical protein A2X11_07845 [Bacteroidetes bacterium GWE2_42_24]OFY26452.1 MAG: hypothetical protein A2X09_02110 [Bacteroidetes bacterium GWF2_43_11]HAQ65470.1 hypothetical protein [Bacteroidales bacterium]HBZ68147.1 hypothetical protein [Bacteroidales bacterium]